MQVEKRGPIALAAGIGAVGLLCCGGYALSRSSAAETSTANFEIPAGGDSNDQTSSPSAPTSAPATPPTPTASATEFKVFVTGAVKRPGVYSFKPGARIDDAIKAAGGYKPGADEDSLNRADYLRDADKVHVETRAEVQAKETVALAGGSSAGASPRRRSSVTHGGLPPVSIAFTAPTPFPLRKPASAVKPSLGPVEPIVVPAPAVPSPSPSTLAIKPATEPTPGRVLGETATLPVALSTDGEETVPPSASGAKTKGSSATKSSHSAGSSRGSASAKFKNPGDGVVNINTASATELEKLPGVGPAMSSRIIEYRQQIGRFTDASQLQDVKGIGEKKFAKMQPFVTVR